jgi:ATP-dependent DNA helicase RecG
MNPALEQLQKVLQLEQKNGYPNTAVIGGLPKMLSFWESNARRAGMDSAFIESVAGLVRQYAEQSAAERAATVQALQAIAQTAANAAPAPAAAPSPSPTAARPASVPSGMAQRRPERPPDRPSERPPERQTEPARYPPKPSPRPTPEANTSVVPNRWPPEQKTATEPPAAPVPPAATSTPAPALPPVPATSAPRATLDAGPAVSPPPAMPAAQPRPQQPRPPRPPKPPKPQAPQQQHAHTRRSEGAEYGEEPIDPRPRRPVVPKPLRAAEPLNTAAGIVGPETASNFARLGINSLRDLLLHFPRRYDDYSRLKTINRLEFGEECSVIATVWEAHLRPFRGGQSKMLKVILSDTTGTLEVTFFNQEYLTKHFTPGRQIVISGRISEYLGRLTIIPEEWEDLDRELLSTSRIVPVYPANADLRQKNIRKLTAQVAQYWAPKQPDPLPATLVAEAGLMSYADALAQIHFPDDQDKLDAARHRLAFDELLLLQLGSQRQRRDWQSHSGQPLAITDTWLASFVASLPYTLTGAQQRAVADIRADLARDVPMNRLLQGDVGSGKTAVAAVAMAAAIQSGAQAAIMAPTSILAEQHYQTLLKLLEPVAGEAGAVRLLQGSTPAGEKVGIYAGLQSGQIKAVVGTHALIEGPVEFANLGLVIVDEQHRFGVSQRAALRGKGENPTASPHLLVMTATPIPRSLALTVYGDLDLSLLDEMPPGRQPITTKLIRAQERERGYAYIRNQLVQGRQAFIIFPLVEESEKIDAKAAVAEHERLQRDVFPDFKLGLLHGRLKPDEKDFVMSRFRTGELQVLVSTSVVEVGVDVPNATVMLIEGANRFGLAQLHQFRGRVGRGEHASVCLLVPDNLGNGAPPDARLQAMEQSQDGFFLAEKDLELRGPGDFLGTRQSGYAGLRMARLSDVLTIEKARRAARQIFERDADLQAPEHQMLAVLFEQFWAPGAGDKS